MRHYNCKTFAKHTPVCLFPRLDSHARIFSADDYTAGYMRSRAMIYFDGTVFWPPPTQLRSTCKIDVTYFPFDSQRCYLKFGSWTYHGKRLVNFIACNS